MCDLVNHSSIYLSPVDPWSIPDLRHQLEVSWVSILHLINLHTYMNCEPWAQLKAPIAQKTSTGREGQPSWFQTQWNDNSHLKMYKYLCMRNVQDLPFSANNDLPNLRNLIWTGMLKITVQLPTSEGCAGLSRQLLCRLFLVHHMSSCWFIWWLGYC